MEKSLCNYIKDIVEQTGQNQFELLPNVNKNVFFLLGNSNKKVKKNVAKTCQKEYNEKGCSTYKPQG